MEDEYLRAVGDGGVLDVQSSTKHLCGPRADVMGDGGEHTRWATSTGSRVSRAPYAGQRRSPKVPLVVTENGNGTHDVLQRVRYLGEDLRSLRDVLDEGIDVRGYFQWSPLDNFEWVLGHDSKFGIVAVDRRTFARTPKLSALWYTKAVHYFSDSVI